MSAHLRQYVSAWSLCQPPDPSCPWWVQIHHMRCGFSGVGASHSPCKGSDGQQAHAEAMRRRVKLSTPALTKKRLSRKGARAMHSFARLRHSSVGKAPANEATETKGLILKGGWRYDLSGWLLDTCWFRGQGRELRQRAIKLARMQPGEQVLDV